MIEHGDGPVRTMNSTIASGPWNKVRDGIYSVTVPKNTACAFDGLTVSFAYNGFKQQGSETHHVTIRNGTIRSTGS